MLSVGKVIVFWQVFCNIWRKKYGSFSPKFSRGFFCQNPFSAILRQKVPITNKLLGPLNFFLRLLLPCPDCKEFLCLVSAEDPALVSLDLDIL